MELSRVERVILSNQLKILGILSPDDRDYYENAQKIIDCGFEYLYSDLFENTYPDNEIIREEEGRHIVDILDMFRGITHSLKSIEDKTGIDQGQLKFRGFDGNYEGKYYSFAKFFCMKFDGGRFPEIGQGYDDFNSHFPVLDVYERMLEIWNTCNEKFCLTKEELIQIANAAIHPDNRKAS